MACTVRRTLQSQGNSYQHNNPATPLPPLPSPTKKKETTKMRTLTISRRMYPFRNDPSSKHEIRLHHPSHIKHQVVAVREPFRRRKRKRQQKDKHARKEHTQKRLELVPPNLLQPQRLRRDHYPPRPLVHPRLGRGVHRGRFSGGRADGGRGRHRFAHLGLCVWSPSEVWICVQRDHERASEGGMGGGGTGGVRVGGG